MLEDMIKLAIERKRGSVHYPSWTVGITNDPSRRKSEHGNPRRWTDWYADSERCARNVEKHFLDKGMKGDTGGGVTPKYVYIF